VSFREKTLLVSFVLMFSLFGYYFWFVSQVSAGNADPDRTLHVFLVVLVLLIVGELVVRAVLRIQNPKEARAARDERERHIELKARGIAYYVLLVAALATVGSVHISTSGYFLAQHVLMAMVLAELTRLGTQIVLFRRDAS
jgi:cytochrome b561